MSVQYGAISWNRQKRVYDVVLVSLVLLYVGRFVSVGAWRNPTATAETLLIRALGTAAFLLLHVVLCIGPLSRLDHDIRYSSDKDLRRGENFRIIELNGAASEATNIYDERNSLLSAYKTLYRQWELVYAIGRANRDLGHKSASALDVFRDWQLYRAISAAYPAAD